MCLQPKHASSAGRIDTCLVPPNRFIPAAMHLTMMSPAQRNRKLVADFPAQRRRLGKTEMMGIDGSTAAHQAWLLGYGFHMLAVANAPRCREGQGRLVDCCLRPSTFFSPARLSLMLVRTVRFISKLAPNGCQLGLERLLDVFSIGRRQ